MDDGDVGGGPGPVYIVPEGPTTHYGHTLTVFLCVCVCVCVCVMHMHACVYALCTLYQKALVLTTDTRSRYIYTHTHMQVYVCIYAPVYNSPPTTHHGHTLTVYSKPQSLNLETLIPGA